MKDLLLTIIQALVDNPEFATVTRTESGSTKIFEIRAKKEDIGKIIGKKGRTMDSIRTIFTAIAAKKRQRIIIEIID